MIVKLYHYHDSTVYHDSEYHHDSTECHEHYVYVGQLL